MSIYIKFIALCLFLIFFSTGTFFYIANVESQKVIREQILGDISQQATNSMRSIERFIYERISDITALAQNNLLRNPKSNPEDINQYLSKLHKINELYYSFSYFDMSRVRKADSKGLDVGKQHSKSTYWVDIEAGKDIVTDISKSQSAKSNVLHFAAVVRDAEGNKVGVIVSRILVENLYEVFKEIPHSKYVKESLQIDLIDKRNLLLYSNHNPKGVLEETFTTFNLWNPLVETDTKLYFSAKERGYLSYQGNEWRLIISVSKNQALTLLQQVRNRLALAILPIVLIGVIISLFTASRLAGPIRKLAKAAEQLGEENWDADTQVNTHDELRLLGKQLHKMGLKIKNKITEQQSQYEEIQSQKTRIVQAFKEIREKNNRITESISYAKRIQMAMLPDEELLRKNFADYFIYFQPKDIVSGDFYWFNQVKVAGKAYFVIAVADCTGHGVPGAILSMLGNNLLSNLITHQNIINTETILLNLNQYIKEELNQQHSQNGTSHDGMEMALAVIDLETYELQFSGASRPLYVVQDGELTELKGDKLTVGGVGYIQKYHNPKHPIEVTSHKVQLQPNDMIYMFSDGFKDQFGSENNVKMGSPKFRELLLEIGYVALTSQKILIDKFFQDWKKGYEQTDDVLVVGIKI